MKLVTIVTVLALADGGETTIQVGKGPRCIALADVNHDGKTDLVVGNEKDGTVSVLLGDGKGSFRPSAGSPFRAGPFPNDIAVADMNSDGNPDLVIANHASPFITILLGDGKGGFAAAPGSPYNVHSRPHPHGVAVADFNGDGKPDVVTDSWGDNQIELLLGIGGGAINPMGRYFPVGQRPYERLRSADFNKDGHADVVTTDLDADTSTILLGDGKGRFHEAAGSPFPSGAKPWEVAIDDMNKDGNLDLVIIPYERDVTDAARVAVTILLGDGKGGFGRKMGAPLPLAGCRGPNDVATGDLNGDGYRDIAVLCAQSQNMMLFFGNRDGTFTARTEHANTGWGGIAVGDLNGDGKDDIVVANNDGDTVTVFFSK